MRVHDDHGMMPMMVVRQDHHLHHATLLLSFCTANTASTGHWPWTVVSCLKAEAYGLFHDSIALKCFCLLNQHKYDLMDAAHSQASRCMH